MKSHFYSAHATALRTELASAVSREELKALHRKSGARHLLIAARQFALLGLSTWALIAISNLVVWIPLAFVQGFEREALAQKLGISPGATRVRLHRALKRLRLAWSEQYLKSQKGESNE